VLTGWSDDVTTLPFETVPGFRNLVARVWGPHKTDTAYVLEPAAVSLLKEEALAQALAFGADVAGGGFDTPRIHYGGALYAAAAERLDHDPFCVPCGEKSASCAHRTLHRMRGTAQSAAGFLDHAAETDAADRHELAEASLRYEEIAAAVDPYLDGKAFQAEWSDHAFRARLKETFLGMAEQHREAAKALAAIAHLPR
jgi:hypothetical protein